MIDMAEISWVIFSHDAFVSQETFANKLCSGILAAKSEMNLDMSWDYLLSVQQIIQSGLDGNKVKTRKTARDGIFVFELNKCFRSLLFCHALLK